MATREVVEYTCDRCGERFDPPATAGTTTGDGRPVILHEAPLITSKPSAPGTIVTDLCGACAQLLHRFLAGGVVSLQNQIRIDPLALNVNPPADPGPGLGAVGRALMEAQLRNRMRS